MRRVEAGGRQRPILPPLLATPAGIAATVIAFGLVYSTLRLASSPAIGTDDAWENVYAQALRPGYILAQPPLYEWLLWTVQQAVGTGVQSFLIVKFALMTASALFLFGAAGFAIRDASIAALAVLSYVLFYQIGWNMLEGVTHTAVLLCACAATTLAFSRAVRSGGLLDHVVLGVALGAGLLSKFGFPLFAAALLAAFLLEPALRARLRPGPLVLALAVALLVASPFLLWVVAGERPVLGTVTRIMTEGGRQSHLVRAGEGVGRLALSLIGFSVPLLPLVVLVFWRSLLRRAPGEDALADAYARAYGRTIAIAIAMALVGILLTGSSRLRERHMHPVLVLLPIWLFARIERGGGSSRRLHVFGSVILAAAVLVLAVRAVGFAAPDRTLCGSACRPSKPYRALTEGLAAMGAGGTLIGLDRYTAGNLRAGFPDARIVMATEPIGFPAPRPPPAACWLVWEDGEKGPVAFEVAARRQRVDPASLPAIAADRHIAGEWRHLWHPAGSRVTSWGVRQVDPAAPLCSRADPSVAPAGEEIDGPATGAPADAD